MRVRDRLRRSAVGIECDRTIGDTATLMELAGVGSLVVLDGRTVVGIVTDRDLVRRAMATRMPLDARVDGVMTPDPVTIDADDDLLDAYEAFRRHGVRRLPVVRAGEFIGMITVDDLLGDLASQLASITTPITTEVHTSHRDNAPPVPVRSRAVEVARA